MKARCLRQSSSSERWIFPLSPFRHGKDTVRWQPAASVKIGNLGTLGPKDDGCYANWRRHVRQTAELCTPIGGDMYAICRKHAAPMTEALSETYSRSPKPQVPGRADGK